MTCLECNDRLVIARSCDRNQNTDCRQGLNRRSPPRDIRAFTFAGPQMLGLATRMARQVMHHSVANMSVRFARQAQRVRAIRRWGDAVLRGRQSTRALK
jgi:hypothetical protein